MFEDSKLDKYDHCSFQEVCIENKTVDATLTFPPSLVLLPGGEVCNHPHPAYSPDFQSQPM
jgi:hypothetical protein